MIDPLMGEPRVAPSTSLRLGDVLMVGNTYQVRVDGVPQSVRWNQNYVPVVGDSVVVLVSAGATGQSSNVVMCKVAAEPNLGPPFEATVTATPAGSPTITVNAGGTSRPAVVAYPSPAIGDLVLLTWRGPVAYAIAKIGATPPPAPPAPGFGPQAPPGAAARGSETFAAVDSGTFQVGAGWNDRTFGRDVVQGPYGGRSSSGAWFYGTSPAMLTGRTITGARIYLPARRRMGNYNDAATFHLYAHNSPGRPGGEPTRTVGPHDITLPPGWGGDWQGIPVSLAVQVVSHGGIAIAGSPYAGFLGRDNNPQSGAIQIDWAT